MIKGGKSTLRKSIRSSVMWQACFWKTDKNIECLQEKFNDVDSDMYVYVHTYTHIYFKEEDWIETPKWVILIPFIPKFSQWTNVLHTQNLLPGSSYTHLENQSGRGGCQRILQQWWKWSILCALQLGVNYWAHEMCLVQLRHSLSVFFYFINV